MRNAIAFLFLFCVTVFMIILGDFIAGVDGAYFAIVVAILMNILAIFNSNIVELNIYHSKLMGDEDPHHIREIVKSLSEKAGIPEPKIYLIETDAANLFSSGRSPKSAAIALTTGLPKLLNKEELTAVIAQTIGHISRKDTFLDGVVATVAGSISGLATVRLTEVFFDEKNKDKKINWTVMRIVAPIAATMVKSVITPQAQFEADILAAKWTDSTHLISALERLVTHKIGTPFQIADSRPATAHLFFINPIHDEKLRKQFLTHPSIEDRIARLKMLESPLTAL